MNEQNEQNEQQAAANAESFIKQHDGAADITLSRPATIAGAAVTNVRMREPLVSDMEASSKKSGTEVEREIGLFANLCEIAPDDIRALPFRDWLRLQAAFALFTD